MSNRKNERLIKYAKEIESKNYRSDAWLKSRWNEYGYFRVGDCFNTPYGPWIPDLINEFDRFIVECDGLIHQQESVKKKDIIKDTWFENEGFNVYRVMAFDELSLYRLGIRLKRNA